MSEIQIFSSENLKKWLERETSSISTPIHSKAQKLLNEMRKALNELNESSKMLSENSQKEAEKKNAKTYSRARGLNKLARLFIDRIRAIKFHEEITYTSFFESVQTTQKALSVIEIDIRNWFPRISPFFILDRRKFQVVFEKTKYQLRELEGFLTKEYVKVKTVEEILALINAFQNFESQLNNLSEQKKKTESEKTQVEHEIAEIQHQTDELRNVGNMGRLGQVEKEIEVLSTELKQSLQPLYKPFVKLISLATHGEGSGLTPEEISRLNQYLANPFNTFVTEEPDYPIFRSILQKLFSRMLEGKLQLKPEKMRKVKQVVEDITVRNSLSSLYKKSKEANLRSKELLSSPDVMETQEKLSRLLAKLKELERRKTLFENEQSLQERTHKEMLGKIHNQKSEVERRVLAFMNKKIQIK